ncbi:MAG: hypothetical protein WDM90_03125 [Ferruginibacter sp.]
MMFTLGREDIFAVDDLGIQQAMCKLYKIDATDKKAMKEKMLQISKKWSPYRTYACRYCGSGKTMLPLRPPTSWWKPGLSGLNFFLFDDDFYIVTISNAVTILVPL